MTIVNLTMGEHTSFGRALFKFWYYNDDLQALAPNLTGCPNTGGVHSCKLSGSKEDLLVWLDLFCETYPTTAKEIGLVKDALNDGELKVIDLSKLLSEKKPYLNWLFHHPKTFRVSNTEMYIEEQEVAKLNFEARRRILTRTTETKNLEELLIDLIINKVPS